MSKLFSGFFSNLGKSASLRFSLFFNLFFYRPQQLHQNYTIKFVLTKSFFRGLTIKNGYFASNFVLHPKRNVRIKQKLKKLAKSSKWIFLYMLQNHFLALVLFDLMPCIFFIFSGPASKTVPRPLGVNRRSCWPVSARWRLRKRRHVSVTGIDPLLVTYLNVLGQ